MAKILTDKEMLEIISRAVNEPEVIDDQDTYMKFLDDIADVICDYFGGKHGLANCCAHSDDLGFTVAFNVDDTVPDDGGIYAAYDTDVVWRGGSELEKSEIGAKAIDVVRRIAYDIHEQKGQQELYNWADSHGIGYAYCRECETKTPCIGDECLSCGSTIKSRSEKMKESELKQYLCIEDGEHFIIEAASMTEARNSAAIYNAEVIREIKKK